MLEFLKRLIPTSGDSPKYQLVEKHDKENDIFVQGVRIKSGKFVNVVFTTSSEIKFRPRGDEVDLDYSYKIEYAPPNTQIDQEEISKIIGNIILDIIKTDSKTKDVDAP